MKANRWICTTCRRSRSTKFCHECGSKRPDETTVNSGRLEDLKRAAMHFRKIEQSSHNTGEKWRDEGRGFTADRMLETSEKWGRYADACEWANAELGVNNP